MNLDTLAQQYRLGHIVKVAKEPWVIIGFCYSLPARSGGPPQAVIVGRHRFQHERIGHIVPNEIEETIPG